ncbi:MAG: hypothetical protein ACI932_001924, partial [Paracoccaceae bacterium]
TSIGAFRVVPTELHAPRKVAATIVSISLDLRIVASFSRLCVLFYDCSAIALHRGKSLVK